MKIVVAGGTGFIGEPLVRRLQSRGEVVVLSRDPSRVRAGRGIHWEPKSDGPWIGEVESADAVINLAGENISGGRWTAARKRQLIDSRLDATHALVSALQRNPSQSRLLINASAVGFYGNRGDELLDESSAIGSGFLAELSRDWETAAHEAEPFARVVILRFGVVLDPKGGALAKMLLPFRLGAGGPIGDGRQWMAWIDREDVIGLVAWSLDRSDARGVYNATAPEPVRNREFATTLGQALHRPSLLPAPAFALRLALGEMAEEALLASQRAVPSRAQQEGFAFAYPDLARSLSHLF